MLAFAVAGVELACLIVIGMRGQVASALAMSPLFLIQALSALLYLQLDREITDVTAGSCSDTNRGLSICASLTCLAMPVFLLGWAIHSEACETRWSDSLLAEERDKAQRAAQRAESRDKEGPGSQEKEGLHEISLEVQEEEQEELVGLEEDLDTLEWWRSRALTQRRKMFKSGHRGLMLYCAFMFMYAAAGFYSGWWPACTRLGKFGLQIWPVAEPTFPGWDAYQGISQDSKPWALALFRFGCYVGFTLIVTLSFSFFRGEFREDSKVVIGWVPMLAFTACGPALGLLLVMAVWSEFASLWSLLAGIFVILGSVVEPVLSRSSFLLNFAKSNPTAAKMLLKDEAARAQKRSWKTMIASLPKGKKRAHGEGCCSGGACSKDIAAVKPAGSDGATPYMGAPRMSVDQLKAMLEQRKLEQRDD